MFKGKYTRRFQTVGSWNVWATNGRYLIPLIHSITLHSRQVGVSGVKTKDFAQQLFVQLILREMPENINLYETLEPITRKHPQFRSNHPLGNTLLWILAQQSKCSEDSFACWFQFCFSAFEKYALKSSVVFQALCLDLMDMMLLRMHITINIRPNYIADLMVLAFSDENFLTSVSRYDWFTICFWTFLEVWNYRKGYTTYTQN